MNATSARFGEYSSRCSARFCAIASSAAGVFADRVSTCQGREGPEGDCYRRFFQNRVRVGAADPERSHSGAARLAVAFPVAQFAVHIERAVIKIDQRIRLEKLRLAGSADARAQARS